MACRRRARSSGRQPFSTASSTGRHDPPTTGRLHPGAEAVLLGAVALLWLKGLLHLDCPGSSPSGLGDGRSLPPEGTQTRLAPKSARRVVVRRMICPTPEECQTSPGRPRGWLPQLHAHILPRGMPESPCGGRSGGAILSQPSTPEAYSATLEPLIGNLGTCRARRRQPYPERAQARPDPSVPRSTLPIDSSTARRFRSIYGREAGLARRSGRTAGFALPCQFRDVVARYRARRRRRAAVPDRRPEWLRQGLA